MAASSPIKVYQTSAIIIYAGLTVVAGSVVLFFEGNAKNTAAIIGLVSAICSLGMMMWRARYTYRAGLWGKSRKYSEADRDQFFGWTAEAFVPERTAIVTVTLLFVAQLVLDGAGIDASAGESLRTFQALLLNGGLIAGLIASPHQLPKTIKEFESCAARDKGWW
ncbi:MULTISPECIES: hypothetical protein [Brevibacterium]|uniref:hypothetical protein n=1 Tax=Brevibacterium TaxID=1696 RepID=UPI0011BE6BC7|nr:MULTISPECIES: hypothetical protein [Brevibacterium]